MTGPYFLIPILMEYFIEYYGFRGGLLIYGGICLHVFLAGFVMKDIKIVGEDEVAITLEVGLTWTYEQDQMKKSNFHFLISDAGSQNESFLPKQEIKNNKLQSLLELLKQPSQVIICSSMLLHFLVRL